VGSPYPYAVALGQNRTEEFLQRLLDRLGIRVERQTELLDFNSGPDSVFATIKRADGSEETVQTPWLIGCDGAHSRVRRVNTQGFAGEEDPHQYVLADVVLDGPVSGDEWHAFLTDSGGLYFNPLPAPRNLVFADIPKHHDAATEAPILEEIQALVSERGPTGARVSDPRWLAYFRIHYRLARHYRQGRTFMAGDAVHVHSLLGGVGMNTGIQDAYNLAWKLALVMRGQAPESLLDSYEIERRQVGEDVVKTTRKITEAAEAFSHLSPGEHEKLYHHVAIPEAERLAEERHREGLDLDYRNSPICAEAEANVAGGASFRSGPHAGAQALDAGPLKIAGQPLTLFELLRGTKHSVLLFAGGERPGGASDSLTSLATAIAVNYGSLLNVFIICAGNEYADTPPPGPAIVGDPEGSLHQRYGAETECLYLNRPDGYIGYRDCQASPDSLRQYVKQVFGH
jgi:2-polyprenyl-6-methoxyphenol hydroxylase-like FAD-dependent oxidoreductase